MYDIIHHNQAKESNLEMVHIATTELMDTNGL